MMFSPLPPRRLRRQTKLEGQRFLQLDNHAIEMTQSA
jgi:hypothetical protein